MQIANGDDNKNQGRDDGRGGGDDHGGGGGGGDDGHHNAFVCASNSGPGTSNGPGDCTIVQFSATGGDNVAACYEQSDDASATQSCSITQNNTTGDNRIFIVQRVDANNGPTQLATQYGGARQTNGTGRNDVLISQDIEQSLKKKDTDPSGTQKQDGHQAGSVTQQSDTGNNLAVVNQSLALSADAQKGTTLSQLQNTDGNVNSNVGVTQFSGSGRTDARVNQSNEYDAHIGKADTGNQQQGSPGGGENVFYVQNTTGLATIQSNQKEDQDLHADRVTHLTQSQYGPQWMDPDQGSNPNDSYKLSQSSSQHASNPTTQDDQQFAQCTTTGNCSVTEHIQQQNRQQNNSCSGSQCDVGNHFITSGGETSQGACTSSPENEGSCAGNTTPPPPPPPFGGCGNICDVGPGNRG